MAAEGGVNRTGLSGGGSIEQGSDKRRRKNPVEKSKEDRSGKCKGEELRLKGSKNSVAVLESRQTDCRS